MMNLQNHCHGENKERAGAELESVPLFMFPTGHIAEILWILQFLCTLQREVVQIGDK